MEYTFSIFLTITTHFVLPNTTHENKTIQLCLGAWIDSKLNKFTLNDKLCNNFVKPFT